MLSTENDHRLVAGTLPVAPRSRTEALLWGYQFNFEIQLYSRLNQRARQRTESLSILGILYLLQAVDGLLSGPTNAGLGGLFFDLDSDLPGQSGLQLQLGANRSDGPALEEYAGLSWEYRF